MSLNSIIVNNQGVSNQLDLPIYMDKSGFQIMEVWIVKVPDPKTRRIILFIKFDNLSPRPFCTVQMNVHTLLFCTCLVCTGGRLATLWNTAGMFSVHSLIPAVKPADRVTECYTLYYCG